MDEVQETSYYDESSETMTVKSTYDNSEVLKQNEKDKNKVLKKGHGLYKSKNSQLVHLGRIHEGDVIRLRSLGYNLLSADRDERRRCLLYIQTEEPWLMRVPGSPIGRTRQVWA